MSDTPRTDAVYERIPSMMDTVKDAEGARELGDLCRILERELAAKQAENVRLSDAILKIQMAISKLIDAEDAENVRLSDDILKIQMAISKLIEDDWDAAVREELLREVK